MMKKVFPVENIFIKEGGPRPPGPSPNALSIGESPCEDMHFCLSR